MRTRKGVSQEKIALAVGVESINFISMVEKGRSKLSLEKFPLYMQAYGATHQEQLVIFRSIWPDVWEALVHLEGVCGTLFREESLEAAYAACLAGIGIDTSGTDTDHQEHQACA